MKIKTQLPSPKDLQTRIHICIRVHTIALTNHWTWFIRTVLELLQENEYETHPAVIRRQQTPYSVTASQNCCQTDVE